MYVTYIDSCIKVIVYYENVFKHQLQDFQAKCQFNKFKLKQILYNVIEYSSCNVNDLGRLSKFMQSYIHTLHTYVYVCRCIIHNSYISYS